MREVIYKALVVKDPIQQRSPEPLLEENVLEVSKIPLRRKGQVVGDCLRRTLKACDKSNV